MDVDPFASIAELCHVSSSQEDRLRHCPFAPEPDEALSREDPQDSGETPVESTGIVMVSPPDSPMEEERNDSSTPQDVFQTPPEGLVLASSEEQRSITFDEIANQKIDGDGLADTNGGEAMAVDRGSTDGVKTVDLGKDSDLGFSEVELAQRITVDSELDCSRGVSRGRENEVSMEFCSKEGLGESPLKKLKISEKNLGLETPKARLGILEAETLENLAKSIGKLKSEKVTPCSLGSKTPQNLQIRENLLVETGVAGELHGESSAKKKLDFSNEPVAPGNNNDETFPPENSGDSGLGDEYTRKLDFLLKEAEKILRNEKLCEADEVQCNGERELARKNIEDIEKFRYVGQSGPYSRELPKNTRVLRALPLSIYRPAENALGGCECNSGLPSPKVQREINLLDVLKKLAGAHRDPSLENVSVWDVAKSRGMTFPRPKSWPEAGFTMDEE